MYTIGLNIEKADSSATLFNNNKIVCHIEEERVTRIKKAKGLFPSESLSYCINLIPNKLDGLSKILIGLDLNLIKNELPKYYEKEAKQYANKQTKESLNYQKNRLSINIDNIKKKIKNILISKGFSENKIPEIDWFEHHYCHALTAHLTSPFEKSLGIVIDGDAEIDCISIFDCNGTSVNKIYTKKLPNSIGWFYKAFTLFCGLDKHEGPGMLMGLAPYGKTNFKIKKNIEKILKWENESDEDFEFSINPEYLYLGERYEDNKGLTKKFVKLFGKPNNDNYDPAQYYKDIAFEAQDRLEKTLYKIFNKFLIQTGHEYVTYSGGVALNCKASGYIWKNNNKIKDIFIAPFSGDDGIGIGACQAYAIKSKINLEKQDYQINNVFLGPEYKNDHIKNSFEKFILNKDLLHKRQIQALHNTLDIDEKNLVLNNQNKKIDNLVSDFIDKNLFYLNDVASVCAKLLSQKYLVAFFQGRMEAGPRALGHRSILGNPSNLDVINDLNKKVKFRQPWRPFCPTVLDEYKNEYFVKTTQSPYMINTFSVTKKCKEAAPACVHVDDTARPQFLVRENNPLFYDLINNFNKITNIPILINSSMNIKGEPICMSPNDAINFFFKTNIDFLCIGNYLIGKKDFHQILEG